jgi:ABC-type multidrug transport system fused ATPase/permease subunit
MFQDKVGCFLLTLNSFFGFFLICHPLRRFSFRRAIANRLPDAVSQLLQNSLYLLGCLCLIAVSSPWFLLVLLPIGVVFHRLHQYFRATTREVKRIESISRSPIFSSFGETLSGLSTIRAFGLQRSFADAHRRLVAANNRSFFVSWMSSRWLALRLDYVSALVLVTSSLLAVALRDQARVSYGGQ